MKARIPPTNKQKKALAIEARAICQKEMERQKNDFTRKIMKLIFYSLYTEFGFSKSRANRLLSAVCENLTRMDTDEIFWEHLDKICIGVQELPFERDYTR